MATPFFPGIENHIPAFQIHIIPGEAVDLANPPHGVPNRPELILYVWIGKFDYLVDIFRGWKPQKPIFDCAGQGCHIISVKGIGGFFTPSGPFPEPWSKRKMTACQKLS
jgi:hypothetical protein